MKLIVNNLEEVSLSYLKKLQTVEGDLEIAKRVVNNDKPSVHYFLGEFSIPFLDYIGGEIMKLEGCYINGVLCFYSTINKEKSKSEFKLFTVYPLNERKILYNRIIKYLFRGKICLYLPLKAMNSDPSLPFFVITRDIWLPSRETAKKRFANICLTCEPFSDT